MPFKVNNRLDILDKQGRWLEARVVDISGSKLKVTFRGYSSNCDEIIDSDKEAYRIKEVGAFSNGYGWGKTNQYREQMRQREQEEE